MNKITWHESAIWFFIAQKSANQYVRKFQNYKISKFKVQNFSFPPTQISKISYFFFNFKIFIKFHKI